MTATITGDAITIGNDAGEPFMTVEHNGDKTFTVTLHKVTLRGPWPSLPPDTAAEDLRELSHFISQAR